MHDVKLMFENFESFVAFRLCLRVGKDLEAKNSFQPVDVCHLIQFEIFIERWENVPGNEKLSRS